jgi:predicted murein hydrolase (TIGR00659 family)
MKELICDSAFFGVVITLITFEIGSAIKKKWKLAIFNPILISIAMIIIFLKLFNIDYSTYEAGSKYISYLLTPATVCLAIPLYKQLTILKNNWKAIISGVLSGAIASMGSIFAMSLAFGFSHEQYVTMLPKSITTAIGMGVSEELGGIVTISVAVIIVTGILGNILAESICKIFKIKEPIAKGVAIGSSSHAVGTSKAFEMGEIEGAMSSLALVISGLITVIGASIFAQLI